MWIELLELAVWLVAFVYPVVVGGQLCRSAREGQALDVRLVTNVTLALILLWMFDVADAVVFSYLFSARSLLLIGRIALSIYLLHPRLLGASGIYERFLSHIVWAYAPCVNETLMQHLGEMERSGFVSYMKNTILTLMNMGVIFLDTSRQLLTTAAGRDLSPNDSEQGINPPLEQMQMPSVRSTPHGWADVFSRESSRISEYIVISPKQMRQQQSVRPFVEYGSDAEIVFSREEVVMPLSRGHVEKK